ncbi:MAG: polysaccharide deacetylase family protein [Desulfosporosinus sp.]|nr:polysaccharide deacetylase family protein [Desulfosporosinus sp.]
MEGGEASDMMDNNPSSLKSVSSNPYLKYMGIFLVVIMITLSLDITYFAKGVSNEPNEPNISNASNTSDNASLNNQSSESLKQLSPSLTSEGPIKVVYQLPVKQPVVYITIDDGWYPNEEVLKLMKQYHLPITTFLIEQAAQKQPTFWHEFVSAGGRIEDHTINHPFLTHLSLAEKKSQISQPIDYFRQYGPQLDELRPPYGDYNTEVGQAAWDSGIKYIVMWDAEMENSTLTLRSSPGLKAGDIILLHWVPGLDQEIIKLLNIIQKLNLGIADLTQALNGEPLTICWLKAPIPVPKPAIPLPKETTKPTGTPGATTTPEIPRKPGATTTPGAIAIPDIPTTPGA